MAAFIDTNIFVRFLVRDDEERFQACLAYFERIERGEEVAATSEATVAEILYVITSRATYRLPYAEAVRRVRPLLELPGIQIPNKTVLLRAVDLFAVNSADFEDCVAVAYAERLKTDGIMSYDRDFASLTNIPRLEPPRIGEPQA